MSNNNLPNSFLQDKKPLALIGKRFLIIADLHIPYHNKKGIEQAISIGKQRKVDTILINGDCIDFYAISRFNKSPKNPDLQNEINTTVEFLQYLRKTFPKANIYFKIGNHESRLQKYLNEHSELFSLECLKLEQLLKFKELRIRLVDSNTIMRIGAVFIAHGHEMNAGGITPAKNVLTKWHSNFIFGHLHRTDDFYFRKPDKSLLEVHSIGCLCNLYPEYWQNNNWNLGCCIVKRINREGKVLIENIRL